MCGSWIIAWSHGKAGETSSIDYFSGNGWNSIVILSAFSVVNSSCATSSWILHVPLVLRSTLNLVIQYPGWGRRKKENKVLSLNEDNTLLTFIRLDEIFHFAYLVFFFYGFKVMIKFVLFSSLCLCFWFSDSWKKKWDWFIFCKNSWLPALIDSC